MINEARISLSGYVATQPTYRETRTGDPSVTMRVAWTPRRMDRVTGEWTDAATSFLTVRCYRKLAENVGTCLRRGDPVVVHGRVTIRDFEGKNGAQRTTVEVDATSVGHDLSRGVAQFQRVRPQTGMTAMEHQAAEESVYGSGHGSPDGPGELAGADGLPGAGGADGPGELGEGAREAAFGSLAGGSRDEMFDEEAVSVLAEEAASAGTPF